MADDETRDAKPRNPAPVAPTQRRYPAAERARLLAGWEAALAAGTGGAYLRQQGVYRTTLARWRDEAADAAKGVSATDHLKLTAEVAQLKRSLAIAKQKLEQAEVIIDVQKKLSLVLGLSLTATTSDPK